MPLYFVETKVAITNNIAEIKFIQYYYNDQSKDIEAQYIFPVHNDCTFTGFEAKFGKETIVSSVKKREVAMAQYDDAVTRGDTVMMAQPLRKSEDLMR